MFMSDSIRRPKVRKPKRPTRSRRTFLQLAQLPITTKIGPFETGVHIQENPWKSCTASSTKDPWAIDHSYISAHGYTHSEKCSLTRIFRVLTKPTVSDLSEECFFTPAERKNGLENIILPKPKKTVKKWSILRWKTARFELKRVVFESKVLLFSRNLWT